MHRTAKILLIGLLALAPTVAHAETSITTSNSSDNAETKSGDATATNSSAAQVGHNGGGETTVDASDIDSRSATNVQEGDNSAEGDQSARSQTGSAVTGQIVGAVADDALTIDATNATVDSEAETGDATSENSFAAFVGLNAASDTAIASDILSGSATNVQEGDNDASVDQFTEAVTGDGVAGQIVGASSTGPTDIVAANTSERTTASSGEATEESSSGLFTGLVATGIIEIS